MQYLRLFESFVDDIKEIKSKQDVLIENLKKEIKSEIDNFMFDVTDEFEIDGSGIGLDLEDETFELFYNVWFKFNSNDIEKLIKLLYETEVRMKSYNVRIVISTRLWTKKEFGGKWEDLRYREFLDITKFEYCIKRVLNDDLYTKGKLCIKVCSI
jgi:hypothetical protein